MANQYAYGYAEPASGKPSRMPQASAHNSRALPLLDGLTGFSKNTLPKNKGGPVRSAGAARFNPSCTQNPMPN